MFLSYYIPVSEWTTFYSFVNIMELLARSSREIWDLTNSNWNGTQNHLVCKQKPIQLAKLTKWWGCVLSTCLYGTLDCIFLSCDLRIPQWIHTLYLPECEGNPWWSRCEIWSLSDSNWTRTKSHLVRKRTLNHLAKLTRWLSYVLSTYLYGAFDCMFLSSHVGVSEWIHTL